MVVTELLARFANPDVMQTLSVSDKLTAGLITTLLGMGITFSALVFLLFIISWMDKALNRTKAEKDKDSQIAPVTPTTVKPKNSNIVPVAPKKVEPKDSKAKKSPQDDTELVAVIAGVIAMKMKTPVENIVIKNIEKLEDRSPVWNRAGIIEQMNSRF